MSIPKLGVQVDRYEDIYQPPELEGVEREKAMDIISSKSGSLNLIPVKLIPLKRYQAAHLLFGLLKVYNLNTEKRIYTI
ncbi:MAG: hypothetical protein J7L41_07880, partial [Synergistetes bacterium]|nr:hypothetical protein [Synergistota bacterium]